MTAVLKAAKDWGCNNDPETKEPPISVPPQYSIIGLYSALPISHRYSSTLDASPVEPKQLPSCMNYIKPKKGKGKIDLSRIHLMYICTGNKHICLQVISVF